MINEIEPIPRTLSENEFSGEIPESICNLNVDFNNNFDFNIFENNFCPPYPECVEEIVGPQDTSECVECSFVLGDLNDDLALNIMDVIMMLNCILSDGCTYCSDINQDGSTDVLDVVDLVNIILDI